LTTLQLHDNIGNDLASTHGVLPRSVYMVFSDSINTPNKNLVTYCAQDGSSTLGTCTDVNADGKTWRCAIPEANLQILGAQRVDVTNATWTGDITLSGSSDLEATYTYSPTLVDITIQDSSSSALSGTQAVLPAYVQFNFTDFMTSPVLSKIDYIDPAGSDSWPVTAFAVQGTAQTALYSCTGSTPASVWTCSVNYVVATTQVFTVTSLTDWTGGITLDGGSVTSAQYTYEPEITAIEFYKRDVNPDVQLSTGAAYLYTHVVFTFTDMVNMNTSATRGKVSVAGVAGSTSMSDCSPIGSGAATRAKWDCPMVTDQWYLPVHVAQSTQDIAVTGTGWAAWDNTQDVDLGSGTLSSAAFTYQPKVVGVHFSLHSNTSIDPNDQLKLTTSAETKLPTWVVLSFLMWCLSQSRLS
jgi:hypothetical protein